VLVDSNCACGGYASFAYLREKLPAIIPAVERNKKKFILSKLLESLNQKLPLYLDMSENAKSSGKVVEDILTTVPPKNSKQVSCLALTYPERNYSIVELPTPELFVVPNLPQSSFTPEAAGFEIIGKGLLVEIELPGHPFCYTSESVWNTPGPVCAMQFSRFDATIRVEGNKTLNRWQVPGSTRLLRGPWKVDFTISEKHAGGVNVDEMLIKSERGVISIFMPFGSLKEINLSEFEPQRVKRKARLQGKCNAEKALLPKCKIF
jgi:hypothetical protein